MSWFGVFGGFGWMEVGCSDCWGVLFRGLGIHFFFIFEVIVGFSVPGVIIGAFLWSFNRLSCVSRFAVLYIPCRSVLSTVRAVSLIVHGMFLAGARPFPPMSSARPVRRPALLFPQLRSLDSFCFPTSHLSCHAFLSAAASTTVSQNPITII